MKEGRIRLRKLRFTNLMSLMRFQIRRRKRRDRNLLNISKDSLLLWMMKLPPQRT